MRRRASPGCPVNLALREDVRAWPFGRDRSDGRPTSGWGVAQEAWAAVRTLDIVIDADSHVCQIARLESCFCGSESYWNHRSLAGRVADPWFALL